MECILVRSAETALKGQNRRYFEKKLAENIKRATKGAYRAVSASHSGIVITPHERAELFAQQLPKVFGISWFAFAQQCRKDIAEITRAAVRMTEAHAGKTFKVEAHRGDKSFPHTSPELNRIIGEAVAAAHRMRVDVHQPDVTLRVEIADEAYLFFEKHRGLSGLPVSSSGKVLCLLSGGIDSAVAAWMMMKRGCRVDYVHFHAFRSSSDVMQSKIAEITGILNQYSLGAQLHLVPFYHYQLAAAAPQRYDLVLFRSFMLRVAAAIAEREGIKALVTGDSIGQVASQTLDNIHAAEPFSIPVLRPLAGMHKEEITGLAGRIGTYDACIKDYKDCCSIIARRPATRAKREDIKELEARIGMERLVSETLALNETIPMKYMMPH